MSSVTLFVKKHLIIRKKTRLLENATTLMSGSLSFYFRMEIKNKTAKLNGRGLHRRSRFNNWRIQNEFISKINFLGTLSGRSRRLGHQTFLISRHDLLPFLSFLSFPQSLLTLPMRGVTTPEMKIHIKRSPNKSSHLINGKTHFLTRECESEMVMALK
jgi:hypothetical protein